MVKGGTLAMILIVIVIVVLFQVLGIWDRTFATFGINPRERYEPRNETIQDQMTFLLERAYNTPGITFKSGEEYLFKKNTYYDDTIAVGTGVRDVEFYCEKSELCKGYYNKLEVVEDFLAPIETCCFGNNCKLGVGNTNLVCKA